MNQVDQIQQTAAPGSIKMFRAMVGVGIMCALLIVMTYEITLPIIKINKTEALEKAVFNVLPGATQKVTFKLNNANSFETLKEEPKNEQLVYAGYNNDGKFVGVAIEASGQGFQDVLRILYGYTPKEQHVVGLYVLESKETPGLGDKIEKDDNFVANFAALDVSLNDDATNLANPVMPVKNGKKVNPWEVDCITGATISSKAIGNIINESTQYWAPIIYQNQEIFEKE